MTARWVQLAANSLRDAWSAARAAEQSLRLAFGDDHPVVRHVADLAKQVHKAQEIVTAAGKKVAAAETPDLRDMRVTYPKKGIKP